MKINRWFVFVLVMLLLSACSSLTPDPLKASPVLEVPTPVKGTTTVVGQALSSVTGKPLANESVRLAEVFYDEGNPHFLLDAAFSPAAVTDANGYFTFTNVEAKEYVLTVGEFFSQWKAVEADGKAVVYTPLPDQVLDVGVIKVDIGR